MVLREGKFLEGQSDPPSRYRVWLRSLVSASEPCSARPLACSGCRRWNSFKKSVSTRQLSYYGRQTEQRVQSLPLSATRTSARCGASSVVAEVPPSLRSAEADPRCQKKPCRHAPDTKPRPRHFADVAMVLDALGMARWSRGTHLGNPVIQNLELQPDRSRGAGRRCRRARIGRRARRCRGSSCSGAA